MLIKGKTALVTGGAQGIGLAICSQLLQNDVKVALCDRNIEKGRSAVEQLKHKYSENHLIFFPVNISDKIQFEDCFNKVISHYGSVDILINNAGVADDGLDNWEHEVDINCKGTTWGCILGMQQLTRGGTIINISSMLAVKPFPLMPIYGMTKAAIQNLTICLGSQAYFEKYGIKVMAVLPGMTDTPILQHRGKRYTFPEMANYREELGKDLGIIQSPIYVAECTIAALKSGKNGSFWVSQDMKPPQILEINYIFKDISCEE